LSTSLFISIGISTNNDLQVLQGSVEILFRWGGKRLHYFAANLFGILHTKTLSVQSKFCRRYDKNIFAYFFLGHGEHTVSVTGSHH